MKHAALVGALAALLLVTACNKGGNRASAQTEAEEDDGPTAEERAAFEPETVDPDPFPSTYAPYPSEITAIRNATVLTGTGERVENGTVVLQDGKIAAVGGSQTAIPDGATVIDADGKWVTPGLIDIHSHLGVYPSPSIRAHSDGNEATNPVTAEVWAEHSVWPLDPGFTRALAGGITSLMILPGSANLVGGRTVTLKNVPSRTVQGMKFPDAPYGVKMACGENPKRVYASRGPATRMGNFAGYRAAWIDAHSYKEKWDDYAEKVQAYKDGDEDKEPEAPTRDLENETLAGVLNGDIRVHMHCYRGDEMAQVLDMAEEFGYQVTAFHHAVEAYKIRDLLAEHEVCGAMWPEWWGFKAEAYDGIPENVALMQDAGACAVVHSDSDTTIQRMNQEAAKAMAAGNRMGLDIPREEAIKWITLNPAKAMGIDDRTGTLETGKMADVVLWDSDPFSVYAKAEQVYVDGALLFDRNDPARSPRMDVELGQLNYDNTGGAGQ